MDGVNERVWATPEEIATSEDLTFRMPDIAIPEVESSFFCEPFKTTGIKEKHHIIRIEVRAWSRNHHCTHAVHTYSNGCFKADTVWSSARVAGRGACPLSVD